MKADIALRLRPFMPQAQKRLLHTKLYLDLFNAAFRISWPNVSSLGGYHICMKNSHLIVQLKALFIVLSICVCNSLLQTDEYFC